MTDNGAVSSGKIVLVSSGFENGMKEWLVLVLEINDSNNANS